MVKRFVCIGLSQICLVAVSACGGSSQTVCVDAETASAYGKAWMEILTIAENQNRIDEVKSVEIRLEALASLKTLTEENWGAYCRQLDQIAIKHRLPKVKLP